MCMEIDADGADQVPRGQTSNLILHITSTGPMHYAPHVPASHGGSDAKAMQDENYA